jgi:DNA-binding transcriptional LysR family regulator
MLPILDVDDMTTYHFFASQNQNDIDIERSFYDDIYGILDGVRLGFGEAVVSKHLISKDSDIEVVQHENRVTSPVILYYQKGRYLSDLQKQVIEMLKGNADRHLNC